MSSHARSDSGWTHTSHKLLVGKLCAKRNECAKRCANGIREPPSTFRFIENSNFRVGLNLLIFCLCQIVWHKQKTNNKNWEDENNFPRVFPKEDFFEKINPLTNDVICERKKKRYRMRKSIKRFISVTKIQ